MRVIPAIDIKDGRCVRLFKGKFDQVTEYPLDPADLAARYQELAGGWSHSGEVERAG